MTGRDYRETSLTSWEASAPGWARWSVAFNAMVRPVSDGMLERLDPRPEPGQPGIFALSDPERIRALVTAAGFDEPVIEEMPVTLEYDGFDHYWDFVQTPAGAVASVLAALPRGGSATPFGTRWRKGRRRSRTMPGARAIPACP